MLLIFLVEVNPTLFDELADVFHHSFVVCVMRCPIMHEYLMRTLSNLEKNVRNELLDLKNIHLPQITWIWSRLTPKWQVVSISWIFNLWTVTTLSRAKLFTQDAVYVDTSHHKRKSEKYPSIPIFFTRLWFLLFCHQAWIINQLDIIITIKLMKWHLQLSVDMRAKSQKVCMTPWPFLSHKRKRSRFKNVIFACKTRWRR